MIILFFKENNINFRKVNLNLFSLTIKLVKLKATTLYNRRKSKCCENMFSSNPQTSLQKREEENINISLNYIKQGTLCKKKFK